MKRWYVTSVTQSMAVRGLIYCKLRHIVGIKLTKESLDVLSNNKKDVQEVGHDVRRVPAGPLA